MPNKAYVPRPDHVFVASDAIRVEWLTEDEWMAAHLDDGNGAETHAEVGRIYMRLRPGKAESRYQETLLHELLHVIWDTTQLTHVDLSKIENTEEFIVGLQSPTLLFILRHNPHLVKWLLSDGDER